MRSRNHALDRTSIQEQHRGWDMDTETTHGMVYPSRDCSQCGDPVRDHTQDGSRNYMWGGISISVPHTLSEISIQALFTGCTLIQDACTGWDIHPQGRL